MENKGAVDLTVIRWSILTLGFFFTAFQAFFIQLALVDSFLSRRFILFSSCVVAFPWFSLSC
jgi:hypothetical protein